MRSKRGVFLIVFSLLTALMLSACGSGSGDEIDTQEVAMSDGKMAVVITNRSEDKILNKIQVRFNAYDNEDKPIEYNAFHPRFAAVSIFPGVSAVAVDESEDELWKGEPVRMDYSIEKANWGSASKPVTIVDTTESYGNYYDVIIKNAGSEDYEFGEDPETSYYLIHAVFRDADGKVTGVSPAYLEGFDTSTYPSIAAGEEIATTAEVDEVYPGECQIVWTWPGVMTQ